MGNKCVFEGTIISIKFYDNTYNVNISPSKYEAPYYIDPKHPKFIELYNKCINGKSYKFVTQHLYIEDIQPLELHYYCDTVRGLLDISNELKKLEDYQQVMFNEPTKHRILIHKNNNLVANHNYKFYYEKAFCQQFYLVTTYEPVEY